MLQKYTLLVREIMEGTRLVLADDEDNAIRTWEPWNEQRDKALLEACQETEHSEQGLLDNQDMQKRFGEKTGIKKVRIAYLVHRYFYLIQSRGQ